LGWALASRMRSTRPTAEASAGPTHQPSATVGGATVRRLAAARKAPEKRRDLQRCRAGKLGRGFTSRHLGRDVYALGTASFRSDPDPPAQRDVPVRPKPATDEFFSPPDTVAVGAKCPRATDHRMSVETADARVVSFAFRVGPGDVKAMFTASAGSPAINAKVDPRLVGGKHSNRVRAIGVSLLGS
jgi:hypothetical protein